MPLWSQPKNQGKRESLDLSGLCKGTTTEAALKCTVLARRSAAASRALEGVYREKDGVPYCDMPSTSGRGMEVNFPLQLRFTGTKAGQPDLQLQIVEFAYGADVNRHLSTRISPPLQGVSAAAGRAASIAFLRLAFPVEFPVVQKWLARAGTAAAIANFGNGAWILTSVGRKGLPKRQMKAGIHWRGTEYWSKRLTKRIMKFQPQMKTVANKAHGYATSAAILATAALLWRHLHPSSHQLMQAIIVAIELSSGYAQTKRNTSLGYIKSGPETEAAWRARHKWAAQRSSTVMTDAYDAPPLLPFLTAAQKLSIGLVMVVNGVPGSAIISDESGACSAWTAGGTGSSWLLTASYPAGKRLNTNTNEDAPAVDASPVVAAVAKPAITSTGSAAQPNPAATAAAAAVQIHPTDQTRVPTPLADQLPSSQGPAQVSLASSTTPSTHFEPSQSEHLATGNLPTICSFEEMMEYKRRQAAPSPALAGAVADPTCGPPAPQSPFEIAAIATQEAVKEDELVLFNTEELIRMDPGINDPGGHTQGDELIPGASGLALYGRADHLQEPALTLADRRDMAFRAAFLLAVFLPFLMLGPLMLMLSSKTKQPQVAVVTEPVVVADSSGELIGEAVSETVVDAVEVPSGMRDAAWRLLLWGIRNSGAAFIKWGQWSATREDMFPVELCRVLAELHDRAPVHTWLESKKEIERAFGKSVEELFESIEHEPMASGSIAQVHRAVMVVDGKRRSMAVKVRHPGVEVRIKQDFKLLKPLAAAASKVKSLKGLSLKESLAQFSSTMTAQTDLRVEAAHLRRFFRNFAPVRASVTPPFPLPEYISESVLIETFEPGQSVAKYIRRPAPYNTQIVALGVDTYLKMLLTDNFVHTDLHPGNILVRRRNGSVLTEETAAEDVRGQLQLILLDFGLAEELTPSVRRHFISFLHMIAAGNGQRAAQHILNWSKDQKCPDPVAFTLAMVELFEEECNIQTPEGIELDKVMKSVLRIARQFEVSIDSSYAALVIGVVVLVGFATSLDPAVNLMDAAAPAFLQHNLLGKISGRLYS